MHDAHGHQGVDRTLQLACSHCYWPDMSKDVKAQCRNYERCVLAKAVQRKVPLYLGSIQASQPHEILAVNFTVIQPASDGRENLLVLTDVFSKYSQAIPTRDQQASMVAEALGRHWFYLSAYPGAADVCLQFYSPPDFWLYTLLLPDVWT